MFEEDTPFEKMPFLFTAFRQAVEYDVRPRELISRKATAATREVTFPFSIQEVKQDSRTAFPFKGGELAANRRLNDYLSVPIRTYKETRNGFGVDDSTKLSAYLANGSLSPRQGETGIDFVDAYMCELNATGCPIGDDKSWPTISQRS